MDNNLEELQSVMKENANPSEQIVGAPRAIRTVCVSCNRRVARLNDVFCSRCSTKSLMQQNRDSVEGLVDDAKPIEDSSIISDNMDSANFNSNPYPPPSTPPPAPLEVLANQEQFSRRDVSKIIGVSSTTIGRWEAKGLIPAAKRFAFSNQCLYTKDQVEQIKQFKKQMYAIREANTPAEHVERIKLNPKLRAGSVSKKLERLVARSMSGQSRNGLL